MWICNSCNKEHEGKREWLRFRVPFGEQPYVHLALCPVCFAEYKSRPKQFLIALEERMKESARLAAEVFKTLEKHLPAKISKRIRKGLDMS